MEVPNSKTGVSVRAYQGDAMTLLAFDLDESQTKISPDSASASRPELESRIT